MAETALSFRVSEDTGRLLAVFDPAAPRPWLDAAAVKDRLAAQGMADLYVDEGAVARMLGEYQSSDEPFELKIGERRGGSCVVDVADDKQAVRLTLAPPCGGAPVTREQLLAALQAKGVVTGLLEDEIEAALAAGSATDIVVARGREAVNGVAATFESLLPEAQDRRPHVDEDGITDYRDLGQLVVVRPGDPLMRRTPPTAGEDGQDVAGRVLSAKPGKNTPFAPRLKGTRPDSADANVLCAAIVGQPVVVSNGVVVEATITVAHVDISTGNIDFDGAVTVKGDVRAGMRILASGDVHVGGSVAAAGIVAGGCVVVKGGVIGGGGEDEDETSGPLSADARTIRCEGSFQARFVENAHVESTTEILIDDYSMHSTLIGGLRVVVGRPGTKTGHIRGGTVSATVLVKAATIGCPTGSKTLVQVGVDPRHRVRLAQSEHDIGVLEKRHADLTKASVRQPGQQATSRGNLQEMAELALALVADELGRLREEAAQLRARLTLAEGARVIVERKIHGGTEIYFGSRRWTTTEDRANGVFRLQEGDIVLGSA